MLKKILITLALIIILPASLKAGEIYRSINDVIKITDHYMDLKTFAYYATEKQRWSLIISNDVSVPRKEIVGDTIKEILDNFCKESEFGWRFYQECLYIANERELTAFFSQFHTLEKQLPDGIKSATYSGYFKSVELSMLCMFLSAVSGTQIRVVNGFDTCIMMRVNEMPWKQVLLSVVFLNRFKLDISDYSILIMPERIEY